MVQFLPLRQKGPMIVGIMWMFQVIAFVLVGFRLYTRVTKSHRYGITDHFYNFAVFCLLVYVVLVTVATRFGLGQSITDPASPETALAFLLMGIAQTMTCVAISSIKISIACFLLKMVGQNRTHQVLIVLPVALMVLALFISTWILWFSCEPLNYAWELSIPGGHCDSPRQGLAVLVAGSMIALVELWYASFPWYLIRGLRMPKREKILIGTSMSMSYISAACSIARLVNLVEQAPNEVSDFLVGIVDILIWHGADICTQLFCTGITVCRPLYKDWLYRVTDGIDDAPGNAANGKQDSTYGARRAPDFVAMRTIGGSEKPLSGATDTTRSHGASSVAHSSKNAGYALKRDLAYQDN